MSNNKNELKLGKIDLYDIDRDEDLFWAVSDLWNIEKHLNTSLNYLVKKMKEEPNDYYSKLFELLSSLLSGIRLERAKHLKRLTKLHMFGVWCVMKHLIGCAAQMGEVAAKDIYLGEIENAKMDFETSKFCHDAFVLINRFGESYEKKDLSKEKQK